MTDNFNFTPKQIETLAAYHAAAFFLHFLSEGSNRFSEKAEENDFDYLNRLSQLFGSSSIITEAPKFCEYLLKKFSKIQKDGVFLGIEMPIPSEGLGQYVDAYGEYAAGQHNDGVFAIYGRFISEISEKIPVVAQAFQTEAASYSKAVQIFVSEAAKGAPQVIQSEFEGHRDR
jgi:hypothetical protein